MPSPVKILRRPAAGAAGPPASLLSGQLAFNENTDILYYGRGDNGSGVATSIITIGGTNLVNTSGTGATGTWGISISGNAATASAWQTGRTISLTGDLTGTSAAWTGSANISFATTLANSGVAAGTYNNSATAITPYTVDAKGRITSAGSPVTITPAWASITSKPTTLAGYGITDAPTTTGTGATGTWGISITGDAASVDGKSFGTFTTGGILYATSTTAASSIGAGTVGQALLSGAAGAPTWTTLTLENLPDAAFKRSVTVATTANITLSGTQTIDGIAVVAGNRVLVKNQTTASQNGIYVVAAGAWSRAADADTSTKIAGAIVNVDAGTSQGGDLWTTVFKTTDTLGSTAMNWYEVVYNSGTWSISTTGSAATWTTGRTIALTGDVTGTSAAFNGSANLSFATTLANSGVTAGTYNNSATQNTPLTVDAKGRITATGAAVTITPAWSSITSKPTTVAGYGITDAATTSGTLAQFAATTSAQLAGVISDETGSGSLVFGTAPTITSLQAATNIDATTTTFSLLSSTATTINAFGAAISLNIGYTGTAASTSNIITGANSSGVIKTINIGTGGVTGSTTNINIAPQDSLGTTIIGNFCDVRGKLRSVSNTSSVSWGTLGIAFEASSATFTDTTSSGTLATPQVASSFGAPIFASTNTLTSNTAVNVYISGAPTQGTNTTIIDSWSLMTAGGASRFDGPISLIGGILPSRGPILTGTISNAGTGYTDGTYTLVPLTGGRGSLAHATITVSGGVVTGVTLTREGSYYQNGDILSATSAAPFSTTGSGFTWAVTSVRGVDLQLYTSQPRIRLGSSNVSVSAGTELGSILFNCQDSTAGGRGDKVRIIAVAEGTSGGGQLQIWTSSNGQEPTLGFLFGGNNDFRLYNSAGTAYHTFSNSPSVNRTITLPDANVTLVSGTMVPTTGTGATGNWGISISGTAAGITGGGAGQLLYQTAGNATGFVSNGTTGQALVSNGSSAPAWTTLTLENLPDAAFKRSVIAATTTNITLSGPQTIDGVSVVAGNRVLVKNQTVASQNGIYVVAAGGWTRAADADTASELGGATVNVDGGTINGGQLWTTSFKTNDTIGATPMNWAKLVEDTSTTPLSIGSTTRILETGSVVTMVTTPTIAGSGLQDGTRSMSTNAFTGIGVGLWIRAYVGGGSVQSIDAVPIGEGARYAEGDLVNSATTGSTISTTAASGTGTVATLSFSAIDQLATTGASGTGTVATITFAAQSAAPYPVNSTITVSGVTPAGYNGTFVVTACTTTSVSYANTTTGAQTVAGTVSLHPWGVGRSITVSGVTPTGYNGTYTITAATATSVSYANTTTGAQTVAGNITPGAGVVNARFQVQRVRRAGVYISSSGSATTGFPRIRLENSNGTIAAGEELGSLIFSSMDTEFFGGRGDKAIIQAVAEGSSGGGTLNFFTSINSSGFASIAAALTGNNRLRLYNSTSTFYSELVSNPTTGNRTLTLPDQNGTILTNQGFTSVGTITLPNTSTTAAPLVFGVSGSLMTTPTDGAMEADQWCFYGTTDGGNRGVIPIIHYIRQVGDSNLLNQTGAQSLFKTSTNGAITLEVGTYEFQMVVNLTGMSTTSGNATFQMGGTGTFSSWLWYAMGIDGAADGATTTWSGSYSRDSTLVAAPLFTATTSSELFAKIEGSFVCSTAGTLIPQILLQTASLASIRVGSFCKIRRIGPVGMGTVGEWS